MDELQLVMGHATHQQGMPGAGGQPGQQVAHQGGHPGGGRRHVHALIAAIDANTASTETPRRVDEPRHQQSMGFQQMLGIGGIPAGQGVIGGDGIAHLLDVAGRTEHPLAIEQGSDLLNAEAVLLDRQGGLDCADAVFAAQAG